ncbi:MAG: hypothetical protein ABIS50_08805 [Luteolibacter sp.]|uniref:hypothetical protein n=1 Tax=Luteolibacter sp. TaxID=1962973 RepID=UPI003262ECF3
MNGKTSNCFRTCSRLLADELQLIRTYTEAVQRFTGSPYQVLIATILANHEKSAAELGAYVDYSGKAFTDLIPPSPQKLPSIGNLVDLPALETLVEGEKLALVASQKALSDAGMTDEIRAYIVENLIPRLQDHVVVLEMITPMRSDLQQNVNKGWLEALYRH